VEQVITVDGLRGRAEALRRLVADLSDRPTAKDPGGLHLFGRGTLEITAGLRRLEARTRRSVWNVQPGLHLDPEDETTPLLDARSRRRGIELHLLVDERGARANPLLASTEREGCRVAPVFLRMLVADGHVAVIEGLACANGEPTAWCAEGGEVVQILSTVMLAEKPYTFLKGAIYIHPTMAEGLYSLMDSVKPVN